MFHARGRTAVAPVLLVLVVLPQLGEAGLSRLVPAIPRVVAVVPGREILLLAEEIGPSCKSPVFEFLGEPLPLQCFQCLMGYSLVLLGFGEGNALA